jgi:hypothetical protein
MTTASLRFGRKGIFTERRLLVCISLERGYLLLSILYILLSCELNSALAEEVILTYLNTASANSKPSAS